MSLDSNAERKAAREEYYRQCSTLTDKCHAFEEGWLAARSQPSEWVAKAIRAALEVMVRDYKAVHGVGDLEMQPALEQAARALEGK